MRYVIPFTFAFTCAFTALLGIDPSPRAPAAAVRSGLEEQLGTIERSAVDGEFREVLARAGTLRDELAAGRPDSRPLLARLEVQVATANLALGDLAGATQALERALAANPALKLDPQTAPRKLAKLLAGLQTGFQLEAATGLEDEAMPAPARKPVGAAPVPAPAPVPVAARPVARPAEPTPVPAAPAAGTQLASAPSAGVLRGLAKMTPEEELAAERWRTMPDSAGWWSARTGQPCRIRFDDVARLTVREGRLDDGQRVNWAEFGDAASVAVLQRADQPIVTPLAFGFHESGGPPAAVWIRFESRGEVRRGVLPLKVGGRYLELGRTAEAPGVLRGRNASLR